MLIDELKERGILEQQIEYDLSHLKLPPHHDEIIDAIRKDRPNDEPSLADFESFMEQTVDTTKLQELYTSFFGDIGFPAKPHVRQIHEEWDNHKSITGLLKQRECTQVPCLDIAEGLTPNLIP